MKILKMHHEVIPHNNGGTVLVRGILLSKNGGHRLPFHYEIPADQEFDHEAHLAELDRQGDQLAATDAVLRSWVGDKQTFEAGGHAVEVVICDCQMMFHAHSRWEVYCAWWETYQGVRSHHQVRWPCKQPNDGPDLSKVQRHVWMLIQSRLGHYQKAHAHRQALEGIATKHGE